MIKINISQRTRKALPEIVTAIEELAAVVNSIIAVKEEVKGDVLEPSTTTLQDDKLVNNDKEENKEPHKNNRKKK